MARRGRGKPGAGVVLHARTRQLIPKDWSVHAMWMALHGETPGGAIIVSDNGDPARTVTMPKTLVELSEPHGRIEVTDMKTMRLARSFVHWVEAPGFLFDEKGLR